MEVKTEGLDKLTKVLKAIAGPMENSAVKLQSNDGKDDNGKEDEEPNLEEGGHSLDN